VYIDGIKNENLPLKNIACHPFKVFFVVSFQYHGLKTITGEAHVGSV